MTSTDIVIRPVSGLDPAQDDLFREWAAVQEASARATFGEDHSSWGVEELRELERSTERLRLSWVALDGDHRVVAGVNVAMPRHDNTTMAGIDLVVHPARRRAGLGTRVLQHAEARAAEHGRTLLLAETQWPVTGTDGCGEGFAAQHGYAAAQTVVRSTLTLPGDRAALRAVLGSRDGDGYAVHTVWDGVPDRWLAGRAELSRRMSTDIPLGDLQLEEEVWDEDRVREGYARIAAMGRRVADTFAVDESTGRLVGYTQVQVGAPPDLAYQQDTLVMREHRGHGLGLRLKAANTLAVMTELPEVTRIRTWNADDNLHMLAVNREIGYEQDAWLREWQKVV
ncbi:GNAT family N-acetyltransferase [Pedococcus aerophilus]|uniref:GNAT family N-acetyltransferase n=1 Tax=Pedococcus aerophilus TaxID=436356 RepID=A0ABP6H4Y9_9MICO